MISTQPPPTRTRFNDDFATHTFFQAALAVDAESRRLVTAQMPAPLGVDEAGLGIARGSNTSWRNMLPHRFEGASSPRRLWDSVSKLRNLSWNLMPRSLRQVGL